MADHSNHYISTNFVKLLFILLKLATRGWQE